MKGYSIMTDLDQTELFGPLTEFFEAEGWGVEVWPTEEEPWGIRAMYPAGSRYSENKAQINVHTNRTFAWLDQWAERNHDSVSEAGPWTGRGWRLKMAEDVKAIARKIGPLAKTDLSFDLDAAPQLDIPRMGKDELKEFVLGLCDGAVFTDRHLRGDSGVTHMVFMPLALGGIPMPDKVRALVPEKAPKPPTPDAPVLDFPAEPVERKPEKPKLPKKPVPPEPEDVPRGLMEQVEWGRIPETELDNYRAGLESFTKVLDTWKSTVLAGWEQQYGEIERQHEKAMTRWGNLEAEWKAECAKLEKGHKKHLKKHQKDLDSFQGRVVEWRAIARESERIGHLVASHYYEPLGIMWEWLRAAGPRSINGYPIFFSMRLLHKKDWLKAHRAYVKEMDRRQAWNITDDLDEDQAEEASP